MPPGRSPYWSLALRMMQWAEWVAPCTPFTFVKRSPLLLWANFLKNQIGRQWKRLFRNGTRPVLRVKSLDLPTHTDRGRIEFKTQSVSQGIHLLTVRNLQSLGQIWGINLELKMHSPTAVPGGITKPAGVSLKGYIP